MPYIREKDFARVRELLETIEELAGRGENGSTHDIVARALKVMGKYVVEPEEEEK